MAIPLVPLALTLTQFAPLLTQIVGGEMPEKTAAKVVAVAKAITGTDDASNVVHVLKTNPQALMEFQRAVADLAVTEERMVLADRQSARGRDIAMIQAGRGSLRADVMVVAAAMGLLGCLGALIYYHNQLPGEAVGIVSTIAGIFGACLKDAYAFEFGSSRGSREKDRQVSELLSHL